MKRSIALAPFLLVGLIACGDDASTDGGVDAADAGTSEDASSDVDASTDAGEEDAGPTGPRIEIGTGQDQFVLLSDGQRVDFAQGPQGSGLSQGGFHIFGAVRAFEIDPMAVTARFEVLEPGTQNVIGSSFQATRNMIPDGSGGYILLAFTAILDDCCPNRGQQLDFRVELTSATNVTYTDEVTVLGDSACRDSGGADICP